MNVKWYMNLLAALYSDSHIHQRLQENFNNKTPKVKNRKKKWPHLTFAPGFPTTVTFLWASLCTLTPEDPGTCALLLLPSQRDVQYYHPWLPCLQLWQSPVIHCLQGSEEGGVPELVGRRGLSSKSLSAPGKSILTGEEGDVRICQWSSV